MSNSVLIMLVSIAAAAVAIAAAIRLRRRSVDAETRLRHALADHKASMAHLEGTVEASRIFEASLDHEKTYADAARFMAPQFCSGCAFFLEEDGMRQVAAAFSDVNAEAAVNEIRLSGSIPHVMRKGRSESIGRCLLVPIPTRSKIAGILVLALKNSDKYEEAAARGDVRWFEDIGRRAGTALERSQALRNSEEANNLKDEFITIISHELRTPLTPILGAVYMLRTEPGDPKIFGRAVDLIERNAKAQSRIVDDLLDASRIISGKLRLEMEPLDFRTVVQTAIDAIRPLTESKKIEIGVSFNAMTGEIRGDGERLQQVVWNLLANSAKFTPNGGKITVELERIGSSAELRIKDTGIGLGADFLPYLFDRSRRGTNSSSRTHGGLGLGLALARHLVESHGGSVHAGSSSGKESVFTVKLPISAASERKAQAIGG